MPRKTDKSVSMSMPQGTIMHGVTVKKLPIGKYVQLMQHASNFLPDIIDAVFTETGDGSGIMRFSDMDAAGLKGVITRAAAVVPEKVIELAGVLLDIPRDEMLDTEKGLTPVELMEILIELLEVNDLSRFFPLGRRLLSLMGMPAASTGSSDGSE